jgi:hypothetical protein
MKPAHVLENMLGRSPAHVPPRGALSSDVARLGLRVYLRTTLGPTHGTGVCFPSAGEETVHKRYYELLTRVVALTELVKTS